MSVETPAKHGHGYRHNSRTVAQAQRLAADGRTADDIANLLATEGISVDPRVVKTWIDEDFARRKRADGRRRMRRVSAEKTKGRLGAGPKRSPEFRIQRMRSLRELGMSYQAIASVMSFDFPDEPINRNQAWTAVAYGTMPRPYARLEREWSEARTG